MNPTLNQRLGQKGYTIVARGPQLGLPQLADGSWHVIGGSNPTQPGQMHEIDGALIPFILSRGGDIVLYRLSDDDMVGAKPVLSRGGMAGRPPELSDVHSFDSDLMRDLSEIHGTIVEVVTPPAQVKARAKPKATLDWRVASCGGAGIALVLGVTAYFMMPLVERGGMDRWVPDMTNPRDVAITRGVTVMAMPSKNNPDIMEMYRVYPTSTGKGVRDNVGSFRKRDLEHWKGDLPDSRVNWRSSY